MLDTAGFSNVACPFNSSLPFVVILPIVCIARYGGPKRARDGKRRTALTSRASLYVWKRSQVGGHSSLGFVVIDPYTDLAEVTWPLQITNGVCD
ncbi:hypothetical protein BD310DRAFT_520549 [Dichomitus squalens]|uniref:Uncharacterized protein n=1 Tax=Dichomitus squalens TaxID=114155 RepID=A0A4V6MWY2_9APHY|nr:hypothetical protein BD310DRAFT_520549 [Dichomitus squalens]